MFLSCHENVGQNLDIKTGIRCFENEAQFRYLGMTITNQILRRRRRMHIGYQWESQKERDH
jgi:hypothetical protein